MCLDLHLFPRQPETREIHFLSCLSCNTLSHLAQEKGFWGAPYSVLYQLMKLTRLPEGGEGYVSFYGGYHLFMEDIIPLFMDIVFMDLIS